ncbi:hypothetical protein [Geomicrobium sediminis]|uniref:YneQ n=1 Tax=Geomicrobium sediminis TaxID=1347788 RepID=A0ABS2PD27_9BACL|nr:hypothetical protein [Geomicrobium sediminis]
MAFGINKQELMQWKERAKQGEISILTHYWVDERFPGCDSVTKVACSDIEKLLQWGKSYGFRPEWVHERGELSHFDVFGDHQKHVLEREGLIEQYERFVNTKPS